MSTCALLLISRSFGMWQKFLRNSNYWNDEMDSFVSTVYNAIEEKTGIDFMDNEGSALYTLQRACKEGNCSSQLLPECTYLERLHLNQVSLTFILRRKRHDKNRFLMSQKFSAPLSEGFRKIRFENKIVTNDYSL